MSWVCTESNKTVKARKAHRCFVCGRLIALGEMHVTRSGLHTIERQWVRMRMHHACEEATSKWGSMDWECFSEGTYTTDDTVLDKQPSE